MIIGSKRHAKSQDRNAEKSIAFGCCHIESCFWNCRHYRANMETIFCWGKSVAFCGKTGKQVRKCKETSRLLMMSFLLLNSYDFQLLFWSVVELREISETPFVLSTHTVSDRKRNTLGGHLTAMFLSLSLKIPRVARRWVCPFCHAFLSLNRERWVMLAHPESRGNIPSDVDFSLQVKKKRLSKNYAGVVNK